MINEKEKKKTSKTSFTTAGSTYLPGFLTEKLLNQRLRWVDSVEFKVANDQSTNIPLNLVYTQH